MAFSTSLHDHEVRTRLYQFLPLQNSLKEGSGTELVEILTSYHHLTVINAVSKFVIEHESEEISQGKGQFWFSFVALVSRQDLSQMEHIPQLAVTSTLASYYR